MNTYAWITMLAGFIGVFGWACWTAGYAAAKVDACAEMSPLDNAMSAEDAARRVQ